jgi:hypothetical protein
MAITDNSFSNLAPNATAKAFAFFAFAVAFGRELSLKAAHSAA